MIKVEFVEGSRTQLRLLVSPPAVEPAVGQMANAADLLFAALNGKMPPRRTLLAESVAVARRADPVSSFSAVRRLQGLLHAVESGRAAAT